MSKKISVWILAVICLFCLSLGLFFSFGVKQASADSSATQSASQGLTFTINDMATTTKYLKTQPATYEATIKVPETVTGRGGVIIGNYRGETDDNNCISFEITDGGKPRIYLRHDDNKSNITQVAFNYDVRKNEKMHLAITIDFENQTATLFVNGETPSGCANVDFTRYGNALTNPISQDDVSFKDLLVLGNDHRSDKTNSYFKGTIYSVALYSDVRTQAEIKSDMQTPSYTDNAILAYDLTSTPINDTVVDLCGNGYNVTLSRANYISFDTNTRFTQETKISSPIKTIEATVKLPNGFTSRGGVIWGNYWNDSYDCFGLEAHENGTIRLFNIDYGKVKTDINFGNVSIATGLWTHVAVTIDGTSATLFINGEKIITKTYSCSEYVTTAEFILGGDLRSGNAQYFKGQIKDVTLYSDVRTDAEIAKDSGTLVNTSDNNLICAFYLADKTSTITIEDLSKNNLDLTKNSLWVNDGTITDPTDFAYSFAVVGDTQKLVPHYANLRDEVVDNYDDHEYPANDSFKKLYDYIINNAESKKIAHVFGLGDITERASVWDWVQNGCPGAPDEEFALAIEQFVRMKEINLDFSLVRGNHESWETYNKWLGTGTQSDILNYADLVDEVYVHPDGTLDYTNSIHYFSAGNLDYMVITLDYGPTDAILAWANEKIAANPYKNVIITTHAYMYRDGTTLDANDSAAPSGYTDGILYDSTTINDGDDIWEKLVSKHPNVVLAMGGHDPSDNVVTSQWEGEHGNVITNILIDPQGLDTVYAKDGCAGAVAMFYMSEDGKTAQIRFYSTARECYIKHSNQYTVNLHTVDADYTVLNNLIAELPEINALTKADAIKVNQAKAIYDNMSTANKEKLVNESKLANAILKINELVSAHTITWVVDGNEYTTVANYGTIPVFEGNAYKYGYVFTGWNTAVTPVTQDTVYTAQFSDTSVWDGTYPNIANGYTFSGNGTQSSPYLIQSAKDFAALSALSQGKNYGTSNVYYKLTVNLDLSFSSFKPICSDVEYKDNAWTQWLYSFGANFDGDNHTITLNENAMRFAYGLFGALSGSISNLIIDGSLNVTGYSGALVSQAHNGAIIKNIINKANITTNGNNVGGIIGNITNDAYITVIDCVNLGNVTSTGVIIGGIIGGGYANAKIINSVNQGNITALNEVGGLIGELYLNGQIINSVNTGEIKADSYISTDLIGTANSSAGKLIGKNYIQGLYTITWIIENQTTYSTFTAGTIPTFEGTPEKQNTAQYTYTFNGWDKTLTAVTGNETYTAVFTESVREYTITWIVDGQSTSTQVAYGSLPSYNGTPTKDADSQYTYTFSGWDKNIDNVTGDETYTAQFTATPIESTESSSSNSSLEDSSDISSSSSSSSSTSSSSSSTNSSSSAENSSNTVISSSQTSVSVEKQPSSRGCGGNVGGTLGIFALIAMLGSMVIIAKKFN